MADIEYFNDGIFVKFIPNTKDGEHIYNTMANEMNGNPTILKRDLKNVLHQIKKAGYTVKKAIRPKTTIDDILNDELFKELGL